VDKQTENFIDWRENVGGPWYGLRFWNENHSPGQRELLRTYVRSILPIRSQLKFADQIWKFVVTEDGYVREVPQDKSLDPHDLPNHFPFDDVIAPILQSLSRLKLEPPPPTLSAQEDQQLFAQRASEEKVAASRRSWRDRIRDLFRSGENNVLPGDEQDSLPQPLFTDRERIARLQNWIDERLADGTLLNSIIQQVKYSHPFANN
jgi:hypothetical protein